MLKRLSLLVILLLSLAAPGWGATYYLRADGTAANKAAGTGPSTDATACMTITTHNAQTFSADDVIKLSSKGGDFRETLIPPSTGSSGHPVIYQAETGETPVILGTVAKSTAGDWTQDNLLTQNFFSGGETTLAAEWNSVTNPNSYITLDSTIKYTGAKSIKFSFASSVYHELTNVFASALPASPTIAFRFYPVSFAADNFSTVEVYDASGNKAARIYLGQSGGTTSNVKVRRYDNAGATADTSEYAVTANAWCHIQVNITTASGTNGAVELIIDGVSKQTLTGFANNTKALIKSCTISGQTSGTTFYVDDVTISTPNAGYNANHWYTSISQTPWPPYEAWRDDVLLTHAANKAALTTTASWWLDTTNSLVYVYATANPTTGGHVFEIAQRECLTIDAAISYLNFSNLYFKRGNRNGLSIKQASHINITDTTVDTAARTGGYFEATFLSFLRCHVFGTIQQHGLYFHYPSEDITIDGCPIHDNGDSGVHFNSGTDSLLPRCVVKNSPIYNNGTVGANYGPAVLDQGCDNLKILSCPCWNNAPAGGVGQIHSDVIGGQTAPKNLEVYNCDIICTDATTAYKGKGLYLGPGVVGAILENNIFYWLAGNVDGQGTAEAVYVAGTATMDYNCFYLPNVLANRFSYNGTYYSTVAAFLAAAGATHSLNADPKFTNASGLLNVDADYKLQPTSPCIGAADKTIWPIGAGGKDYFGNPVPGYYRLPGTSTMQQSGVFQRKYRWSIGAHEPVRGVTSR